MAIVSCRVLKLVAAGLMLAILSFPAAAAETAGGPVRRECFDEGTGQRHCANLAYDCDSADTSCLIDDLSGAILRAYGDTSAKYAAYLARGIISKRALRVADAIADFEAAQWLQPKLATPLILMGQAYGELGHHARALVSFDEANRRSPDLPVILMQRAATRQNLGHIDGAIADLTQAISVMRSGRPVPEGAEEPAEVLLVARGHLSMANGDRAAARADFEAALKSTPGFTPAREALAKLGAQ